MSVGIWTRDLHEWSLLVLISEFNFTVPAEQSPDLENTQLFAIFSGSVACHSSSLWGSQVACIHFTFQEKKITCDQYWVTYGLNGDRGSYAINSPGLDLSVFSVDRACPDCIWEKNYIIIFLKFYLLVALAPKKQKKTCLTVNNTLLITSYRAIHQPQGFFIFSGSFARHHSWR